MDGKHGTDTVVGLGSNLGDRLATLRAAIRELARLGGGLGAVSALYETDAVGLPGPPFLNAAVRLDWDGSPSALLARLLSIEQGLGRVRRERWGPRTVDLDVLWMAGTSLDTADLVVPHARLLARRFALEPLLDVAPEALHPVTGVALRTSLATLPPAGVRRIAEMGWVAPRAQGG